LQLNFCIIADLCSLFPRDLALQQLTKGIGPQCCDPIGAFNACFAGLKKTPKVIPFVERLHSSFYSKEITWASMRMDRGSLVWDCGPDDVFAAIASSKDIGLWRLLIGELCSMRHPVTGDTLLHVAVRVSMVDAVRACFARYINPFVRNVAGEDALCLARIGGNSQILAMLQQYYVFKPITFHADWMGPYFVKVQR
jgi:hypothetical protein